MIRAHLHRVRRSPRWSEPACYLVVWSSARGHRAVAIRAIYNKDVHQHVDVTLRHRRRRHRAAGRLRRQGPRHRHRVGHRRSPATAPARACTCDLDPDKAAKLPANVTGRAAAQDAVRRALRRPRAAGRRRAARTCKSGDTIQPGHLGRADELEQVFADLLPVLQAVQPAKLADRRSARIAASLHGRGRNIGQTIDELVGLPEEVRAEGAGSSAHDLDKFGAVAQHLHDRRARPRVSALRDFAASQPDARAGARTVHRAVRTASPTRPTGSAEFVGDATRRQLIALSRRQPADAAACSRSTRSEFPCLSRGAGRLHPGRGQGARRGHQRAGPARERCRSCPRAGPYTTGADASNAERRPELPAASRHGRPAPRSRRAGCDGRPHRRRPATGIGPRHANSPQENEVIAELMAAFGRHDAATVPAVGQPAARPGAARDGGGDASEVADRPDHQEPDLHHRHRARHRRPARDDLSSGVSGNAAGYSAVFTDVTSLNIGDDVRMAGVRIGSVTGISVTDRRDALGALPDQLRRQARLDRPRDDPVPQPGRPALHRTRPGRRLARRPVAEWPHPAARPHARRRWT